MTRHPKAIAIGLAALSGLLAAVNAWLARARRTPPPYSAPHDLPSRPTRVLDTRLATRDELYAAAKRLDIPGRSRMRKAQLQRAVAERTKEVTFV